MILDIYETMLKTARATEVPKYVGITFNISKSKSKEFWEDKSLEKEHDIVFHEWEPVKNSRYEKMFCGIKFAIQFNHKED